MTEPRIIQNFSGYRATIITDARPAVEQLHATLTKLSLLPIYADIVDGHVQLEITTLNADQDVLFIDSDVNVAIEIPFHQKISLLPVIGIVGVEAPSRLKSLMLLGATAVLRKPVHGGSVYSALFMGINEFRRRRALMDNLDDHERRRRSRRHLVKAIIAIMKTTGCDEDHAYDRLRRESMHQRMNLEDYCESFIRAFPGASEPEPSLQGKLWADKSQ